MATAGNNFESRQKVLGYPVDVVNESEALSMVENSWELARTMHVVTINAEMVIQAQKDNRLDRIIRHAHLIVPDGAGAVFALKLDGHDSVRVPGIELAEKALASAARKGIPVALLGSKAEIIEKLRKDLPKIHPGLNICASHDGYIDETEEEAVVREIAESKPGLLFSHGCSETRVFHRQMDKPLPRYSNNRSRWKFRCFCRSGETGTGSLSEASSRMVLPIDERALEIQSDGFNPPQLRFSSVVQSFF